MPRHDLTIPACLTAIMALAFVSACGKKQTAPSADATLPESPVVSDKLAAQELSNKVEAFTGARTKMVWSQYQKEKSTDPRSNNAGHFLMGLDTKEGLGARAIIAREDNYTRPILTSDGETILYTRKTVTWDARDAKHCSTVVMRTDWKGSAPVEISDGYAVDTWVDPATHTEWVYAVRDIIPSPLVSLEAKKLIRFQLSDPNQEQLVWDQTKVSPDNIQFSRDGRRASGQFPSPETGQFVFDAKAGFKKLPAGNWPSMAPDNSYVSWILEGQNKSLILFADDAKKPWTVALTTTPDLAKGEVCHPCWSNHPRFITLTGPYLPAADPSEGSAIAKGGLTSEVFIGKFSEKLDKIDAWLRVTDNALNDNYPDVWIEGGDTAELRSFTQTHDPKPAASPAINWPPSTDGLVFQWENRDGDNTVKLPGGRELDCGLGRRGAARYGRSLEMLLDAGTFALKADAAGIINDAVLSAMPLAVEFILHIDGDVQAAHGTLATFPHLRVSLRDGIISAETSAGILGIGPIQGGISHVTAASGDRGYSITLQEADGKSMTKISAAKPRQAQGRGSEITFGGGGKGIGMSHVAVYARALATAEIRDHAKALASLSRPPPATTLKLRAKLIQASPMPTVKGISPDTSSLIECIYEVVNVIEGDYPAKRILVKHWGMMDGKPARGFPRRIGIDYELHLQPFSAQPQVKDIRSVSLGVPDLDPWFDISTPAVAR